MSPYFYKEIAKIEAEKQIKKIKNRFICLLVILISIIITGIIIIL